MRLYFQKKSYFISKLTSGNTVIVMWMHLHRYQARFVNQINKRRTTRLIFYFLVCLASFWISFLSPYVWGRSFSFLRALIWLRKANFSIEKSPKIVNASRDYCYKIVDTPRTLNVINFFKKNSFSIKHLEFLMILDIECDKFSNNSISIKAPWIFLISQ